MGVRSRISDGLTRVAKVFGPGEPPEIAAAAQTAGMTPATPFSPGEPLRPYDGYSRMPRSREFVPGYNIASRPRRNERVSFETLQGLIDAYDVASICIWHRIDSLRSLDWSLIPAREEDGDVTDAIDYGTKALAKPDGDTPFESWLAKWLFDVLAFDAGCLYRIRNRGGRTVGLKVVEGTCYSDDTEVLTRSGWKRFADVDITRDEFATRHQKTKAFEWQTATHYTVQDWSGREPLYRFHSRSYDLLVTGNHRMLVTSLPKGLGGNAHRKGETFVPAEDLAKHFTRRTAIPATSVWAGTPITEFHLSPVSRGACVTMSGVRAARKALGWSQATAEKTAGLSHQTYWSAENGRQVELATAEAIHDVLGDAVAWEKTGSLAKIDTVAGDDFVAFMGMWLSEGSLSGRSDYIYVSQRQESKGYEEFRGLLIRMLGSEPRYDGSAWRFKSAALTRYLRQFGHAQDKFIPSEVLDASAEQLAIFWRFYMLGDGCYSGDRERIVTASKRMADGLQEVAQKIGRQASVREHRPAAEGCALANGRVIRSERTHYVVSLRSSTEHLVQHVDRVPYGGNVYCVTVPNETLYVRRNGQPAWCGNTIAPLLDNWGDVPKPPAEAFVQYVNGLAWNWLTTDDLIYQPFRPRSRTLYGTAPLESILLNANTDLRFQAYFMQRFTDGNIPEAFATAPEGWTPDQIEQFQAKWDALIYGDQSAKAQIKWTPAGTKFSWSNEKDFSDQFSLFLMRKTCSAYHVVPSDLGFTEDVNRSSGESQADVQHRVGDLPLIRYVQGVLTRYLQDDLCLPVRFAFDLGEEQDDRLDQANADQIYIQNAVVSASEIREMRFGLPEPDGRPVPRLFLTQRGGPVPLNAVMGVAGEIDRETGAPAPDAKLPDTVFAPIEGVVPNPPMTMPPLAEQIYGQQASAGLNVPPGEDRPLAKDAAAAPAAGGITADTGIVGYDLVGADEDEDGDREGDEAVEKELAAFRRFVKGCARRARWRDFEFTVLPSRVARELNAAARVRVTNGAPRELVAKRDALDPPQAPTAHQVADADPTARAVYEQLVEDYPPEALGWILGVRWTGPQQVPLERVDFHNADTWAASHQPKHVAKMIRKITAGKRKPVILIDRPGHDRAMIVDGHHRSLAYQHLGEPVTAYVGHATRVDGPWDELHDSQNRDKHPKASKVTKAAGGVQVAGLAVLAADTGRVLMLQRALVDDDPAAGMWECPGGHLEPGESPLAAACREWSEETGHILPFVPDTAAALAFGNGPTWTSGIYQGFVYQVPSEDVIDLTDRDAVTNPDDPGGDAIEALAWWEPAQLEGNRAVRPELLASLPSVLPLLAAPPIVKADGGGADPKVLGQWPGWRYDADAARWWAPRVAAALAAAVDTQALASAWAVQHPADGRERSKAERKAELALLKAIAVAFVASRIPDLPSALASLLPGIYTDGYLIGTRAAREVIDGTPTDLGDWTPGDTETANELIDAAGDQAGLRALFGAAQDSIGLIVNARVNEIAAALAKGTIRGDSPDTIGAALRSLLADPDRAIGIALTEITRAASAGSDVVYRSRGIAAIRWMTEPDACDPCADNADAGAVPLGTPFPSGDLGAPEHPRCRCWTAPA